MSKTRKMLKIAQRPTGRGVAHGGGGVSLFPCCTSIYRAYNNSRTKEGLLQKWARWGIFEWGTYSNPAPQIKKALYSGSLWNGWLSYTCLLTLSLSLSLSASEDVSLLNKRINRHTSFDNDECVATFQQRFKARRRSKKKLEKY